MPGCEPKQVDQPGLGRSVGSPVTGSRIRRKGGRGFVPVHVQFAGRSTAARLLSRSATWPGLRLTLRQHTASSAGAGADASIICWIRARWPSVRVGSLISLLSRSVATRWARRARSFGICFVSSLRDIQSADHRCGDPHHACGRRRARHADRRFAT